MSKRIIINADDFGIHESVNRAVYRGFESGILTSTSIMAGGKAFDDAVHAARDMEGIGIGIHLTLVGCLPTVLPAAEVPSLTWEGGVLCRNYLDLIMRDLKGLIRADDVYREWDSQIQKVLDTGLSVTHIDGHQHLHMWNHFFPIALSLCKKYGIRCMRVPDEKLFFGVRATNLFRSIAGSGLSFLSGRHRGMLKQMDIYSNDHFYGMLYGGHFTESRMFGVLDHIEDGVTEFMCHPSADSVSMENEFHWGYQGEEELKSLLSVPIKEKLISKQISLISYGELLSRRG